MQMRLQLQLRRVAPIPPSTREDASRWHLPTARPVAAGASQIAAWANFKSCWLV